MVKLGSVGEAIVGVADAIAFLGDRWDSMERANPHSTVFQTREWYTAWIHAVSAGEFAQPVIICTPEADLPRAALALQISRKPSSPPLLRPLSAPWADYHEAVGNPADREAVVMLGAALLHFVERWPMPVVFDDVKPRGMLAAIMKEVPCSSGHSSVTELIGLDDDENWKRIQQHREYSMKWRRLCRLGDVNCLHHTHPQIVLGKLPGFIAMHQRQWSDRPEAIATFDDALVDAGFRAIAEHLGPRRIVMLTELTLNAKPLAMYFGFVWQHTYFAYRTTYEKAFARFSPGHLMLRRMMGDFRDAGFAELDLMRGGYAYKREYSNSASRNLSFKIGGVAALPEGQQSVGRV